VVYKKNVEVQKGKGGYFLSTSRTRTGGFHVTKLTGALIKLDGKKLSNNLAGKAMDYYPDHIRQYDPRGFEQEDRIFSHKPVIENIQKYILRIDILISDNVGSDMFKKYINQLAYMAYSFGKKNNIDVNIYDNKKSFISGSNNTLSFEDIKKLNTKDKTATEDNRRSISKNELDELRFIYKALAFDDFNRLSSKEQDTMKKYLRYFESEKNNPGGLITTLHNVTNTPKAKNILHKIYEKMRGYGIKNINPQKITKAIYIKWKHILGPV